MAEQMKKKPLVSAITNFFNAEKFFEEAIESVFAQTYDNWELLLVDDGSTDASTAIALRYARDYPDKVRYLQHEGHVNRGRCASRDLGIQNAKGEYIALLDADDVWLPQKLEQQVALMDSNPEAALVCGPTQYWYSWRGNLQDSRHDRTREIEVTPNKLFYPPQLLTLLLQSKAKTPATCSFLMKREPLAKIGGFGEFEQALYEDQAFFAKVYLKAPVFVHSQYWDRYRQHSDSTCSTALKTGQLHRFKPNTAHLTFLNWISQYLTKEGVKDAEIWQALQKALWPYHHPRLYFFLYPLKRILLSIKYRLHYLRSKL